MGLWVLNTGLLKFLGKKTLKLTNQLLHVMYNYKPADWCLNVHFQETSLRPEDPFIGFSLMKYSVRRLFSLVVKTIILSASSRLVVFYTLWVIPNARESVILHQGIRKPLSHDCKMKPAVNLFPGWFFIHDENDSWLIAFPSWQLRSLF